MNADSAEMRQSGTSSIAGLSNFRDFGGVAVASGQRVVPGWLHRSAAPGDMAGEGVAALGQVGIGVIVDLRGTHERASRLSPALEAAGMRVVSTPIEPRTSGRIRAALAEGTASHDRMRALMAQSYRDYVAETAPAFGDALAAIVMSDRPVLIHCTAGKDRTGFVVAVLLHALGVPRAAIFADYLRTNADWDRASVAGHLPLGSDIVEPVLVADAGYLDAAFDEITRIDGHVDAFIARATGGRVTPDHLEALIEKGQPA